MRIFLTTSIIAALPALVYATDPAPATPTAAPAAAVAAEVESSAAPTQAEVKAPKNESLKSKWQKFETDLDQLPEDARGEVKAYIEKIKEANLMRQSAYEKLSGASKEFVKKHRIAIFHSAKKDHGSTKKAAATN